ncbi:putative DNA binding domain-containing protein [Candidatus Woesearchaeota archaeon]|nr:putative DNA binding domain-containing protein [Candidatus Woesearchaeota archaeon]
MKFKESQTVELKESLARLNDALETICSFLNHRGGTVYFGVKDKDGKVIGTTVSDTSLRKISQQIHQRIKPEFNPQIRELQVEGKSIIEVKIPQGPNKPYFLNGIAYRKVGTEKRIIPPDDLKKMIFEQKQTKWDEEICKSASLQDIDERAINVFRERYEEINKISVKGSNTELLKSLKCIRVINKKVRITNAGILLFGKEPKAFFPMDYITMVRYPGEEKAQTYSDIKDIYGNLFDIVDSTDEYIRQHIQEISQVVAGSLARKVIPQYPYFAIRELITNAVVHRDYSNMGSRIIIRMFKDRIEFNSPGGLPANVTPQNIVHEQYSRNPVIADVFNRVKFIEKLGEGWDKNY